MTPHLTASGYLPPKKVSPWRYIGAAAGYLLVYGALRIAIAVVYQLYLELSAPDHMSPSAQSEWVTDQFNQNGNLLMIVIDLLLIAALALWFFFRKRPVMASLGLGKTRLFPIPLAVIAGVGMSCLLGFVMSYIARFAPDLMNSYGDSMETNYNMEELLLYTLAGVIGAPLVEEIFFRHLVAGRMGKAVSRVLTVVLTSVLFGLVHDHPVQQVYAAVLGLVMACVYFAYDSVWVSASFHAGFNAVSLLSFLDLSGLSAEQQMLAGETVFILEILFAVGGTSALTLLFVYRTHKIFQRPQAEAEEEAIPLYTDAPIPGVAPVGGVDFFSAPSKQEEQTAAALPSDGDVPKEEA